MLNYSLFMPFHISKYWQNQAKINVISSLKEKVYILKAGWGDHLTNLSSVMASSDYELIMFIRILVFYFYCFCQYQEESCLSSLLALPTLNYKCME